MRPEEGHDPAWCPWCWAQFGVKFVFGFVVIAVVVALCGYAWLGFIMLCVKLAKSLGWI